MSDHVREHLSVLASAEKRLLIWMAAPHALGHPFRPPDLARPGGDGAGGRRVAAARWDRRALWLVVVALAINWFGDSLDGTLARVRHVERPRYGFYVDHVARHRGRDAALRRARVLAVHVAGHCAGAARGLSPRVR